MHRTYENCVNEEEERILQNKHPLYYCRYKVTCPLQNGGAHPNHMVGPRELRIKQDWV